MYYPVTDAAMDTGSYEQFAEGYYLTAKAMAWFWDAYVPDVERRSRALRVAAARAATSSSPGSRRRSLIVDEADVLRDEGEAYAARLRAAGVAVTTVRYDGTIHDFMMLNPLSEHPRDARRRSPRPSRSCARCSTAHERRPHEPRHNVIVASPEEAYNDKAELWCATSMVAVTTILHAGRLHLRIDPRRDGRPWLADVVGLARALTEAQERLAAY